MANAPKRPRGREKNVTGAGKGVGRRGDGLGTGPVGSGSQAPAVQAAKAPWSPSF